MCRVNQHSIPRFSTVSGVPEIRAALARVAPAVCSPVVQQVGLCLKLEERRVGQSFPPAVHCSGGKAASVFAIITIKPAKEQAQLTCGPSHRRLNSSWSNTI